MDRCDVISWIFVGSRRNSLLSVNWYDCSFVEPENVRDNAVCREIETCSRQGKMLSIVYWSIGQTALWYMCNKGVKYVETSSNTSTQVRNMQCIVSSFINGNLFTFFSFYTIISHSFSKSGFRTRTSGAHPILKLTMFFLLYNFDCITDIHFKSQHAMGIACILFSTLTTNTWGMYEGVSEQPKT